MSPTSETVQKRCGFVGRHTAQPGAVVPNARHAVSEAQQQGERSERCCEGERASGLREQPLRERMPGLRVPAIQCHLS